MRFLLLSALLPAALLSPVAHATTTDDIHGRCFLGLNTAAGVSIGVIGDLSVTTTGDQPPAPIGATVTCSVQVNGVVAPGTTHSYTGVSGATGVQAGLDPLTLPMTSTDTVDICTSVVFDDATTTKFCVPTNSVGTDTLLPLLEQPGGWCNDTLFRCVDYTVCPVLVSHAGEYPGVTIEPDGDVYLDAPDPLGLGLDFIYDCPPYEVPPGVSAGA